MSNTYFIFRRSSPTKLVARNMFLRSTIGNPMPCHSSSRRAGYGRLPVRAAVQFFRTGNLALARWLRKQRKKSGSYLLSIRYAVCITCEEASRSGPSPCACLPQFTVACKFTATMGPGYEDLVETSAQLRWRYIRNVRSRKLLRHVKDEVKREVPLRITTGVRRWFFHLAFSAHPII